MKRKSVLRRLVSSVIIMVMMLTMLPDAMPTKVSAAASSKNLASTYFNATTKYLHLGDEGAGSFNFNIKKEAKKPGATYTWYVKADKGNPKAVSINRKNGVVTAKEAGTAYIRCKITFADGTYIRPEAKVTVRNNITGVKIKNLPDDMTISAGITYDFNRTILNTKAGKGKKTGGITRWEIQDDTAGVVSASDKGIVYPVQSGEFNIRAVSFQSKAKHNSWLEDKEINKKFITASSDWHTIMVESSDGQAIANTQEQLNKALLSDEITDIALSSEKGVLFTIEEGDYSTKSLTVDTPKADIENHGVFKEITIKDIKDTTWIEYADGNIVYLLDDNLTFVIDKDAKIKRIVVDTPNSVVNFEIHGQVDMISVLQPSQINLSGDSKNVPISIEENAEGSKIASSVFLDLTLNANTEIVLDKGAEETKIDKSASSVKVQIENKSEKDIVITTNKANPETIESGAKGTSSEETVPTPVPSPGGGGGYTPPVPTPTPTPTPKPEEPEVLVSAITVNKSTTTLTVGATETITATVEPGDASNKNVTWTSSKDAIATVDANGKITAVAVGEAVITVTSVADSSKKATVGVTVKAETLVSDFVFDASTKTITGYTGTEKSVAIPAKIGGVDVEVIGDKAFSNKYLTSVVIPNSVTSIEKHAFIANKLTSVVIPDSVTSIKQGAFSYNELTSINIPNSITTIEKEVFEYNKLTSIVIPDSVTSIGEFAFLANELTSLVIPESVITIKLSAFLENKLTSLIIPNSVKTIEEAAFNNNQLPDSQAFIYARNADGSEDKSKIVSYGGAKRENVIIPDSVKTIGEAAFMDNELLSITIPNSVTTIEDYAFGGNKLTEVTIPISVTNLGDGAFEDNGPSSTSGNIPTSDFVGTWEIKDSSEVWTKKGVVSVSAISVTGDAVVGATLTAAPTPGTATGTYQWKSSDIANGTYANITGATSSTYVIDGAYAGKFIKVTFTATGSYSGTQTSVATGAVAPAPFKAVTGITGVATTGTVNEALALTGTVAPAEATNKTITWTVKSGTATITDGNLTATAAGDVVVTATITNGLTASTDYTEDFTITFSEAFKAVTGITGVATTGTVNEALALTGTVAPAEATNKTITWTVKSGTATITDGNLTATAAGDVVVTATITNGLTASTDYTEDFTITFSEAFKAVTGITGVATTGTVNEALALTGTVAPAEATNKTITWTVKSGTATITDGNLTATAAGDVVVTATITNGLTASTDYTEDFTITFSEAFKAVTGITGVATTGTVNEALALTGTVAPAEATNKTITWTVKSGTATITDGNLTATAAGDVVVTATITNGLTASTDYTEDFTITFSEAFKAVTGITGVATTGTVNEALALTGTVAPAEATNKTITWTVKSGTATITDGNLTATAAGDVVVTATITNGLTASTDYTEDFTITFSEAFKAVTGITGVATTGTVNEALALTGTVAPAEATNKTITWTVKSGTATITDGNLTATAAGDVVVTATITNGLTASTDYTEDFTITFSEAFKAVTGITGVATTGTVNEALALTGTVAPAEATNKTITWTVKSGTATITDGNLTATAAGDVVVTATITNGLTASTDYTEDFTITFSEAFKAVTGITGVATTGTVNEALALTGTVAPAEATNKTITWTVKSGTATITDGNLTATAAGDVVVTATITNGLTASTDYTEDFTITFSEAFKAVTGITGVATTGTVNEALALTGTVAPAEATNKTITWTVKSGTATITDGNLTATAAGDVVVTATITNGLTASTDYTEDFTITFSEAFKAVTGITGVATTGTVNEALALTGTVAPAEATNKTITWTVKSGTATITDGNLTATAAGDVVVTATITNGLTASTDYTEDFTITFSEAFKAVTGITGVATTGTVNEALALTGTVAPAEATNKTITWTVKSGTATITDGNLTATAAGDVVVTATITNGLTASTDYTEDFTITFSEAFKAVTGITGVATTGTVNEALALTGTVAPAEATNKTITWTVKSGTATITDGNLTATAAGDVVVTATITNGLTASTDYTEDFTITITEATPDEYFVFSTETGTITELTDIGKTHFGTNLVIPDSINGVVVKAIGNNAFANYGCTSLVLPINLETIGSGAFKYNKFTTVIIPNSVTSIGSFAFLNNELTEVTIPDSVTTIGEGAFENNKLTKVTIPGSVTYLGAKEFLENGPEKNTTNTPTEAGTWNVVEVDGSYVWQKQS